MMCASARNRAQTLAETTLRDCGSGPVHGALLSAGTLPAWGPASGKVRRKRASRKRLLRREAQKEIALRRSEKTWAGRRHKLTKLRPGPERQFGRRLRECRRV